MKVLFDHQIFSYQAYGGISRYFVELMNQFRSTHAVAFELALKFSDNEYLSNDRRGADVLPFLHRSSRIRTLTRYLLNRRESNKALKRARYDLFHPTFFDP